MSNDQTATMKPLDNLRSLHAKLGGLLDDPQPGLVTWNIMVREVLLDLAKLTVEHDATTEPGKLRAEGMSEHTPGPWHVHENAPNEIWAKRGPIAMTTARAVDADFGNEEEANAQLIAAAPDMLEACNGLLHRWNKEGKWPTVGDMLKIHNAAAKATEEPKR